MDVIVEKKNGLKGEIEIPPDKSISHRSAMFLALSGGTSKISNFSKGVDCHSTLDIVRALGCEIEFKSEQDLIIKAPKKLIKPEKSLDCGNSGTTMRLMSGILAAQDFSCELIGDESLSKRPMKRVIEPLELMGARISHNNFMAPLKIEGHVLRGIDYVSKLASAQVKSCILLAGLFADGKTNFCEPYKSRNHTELMLKYLGAQLEQMHVDCGEKVSIQHSKLEPKDLTICGDISSAAFFMVAAAIVPNSEITLKNVGINPTRAGIIDIMQKMGVDLTLINKRKVCNEDVADIKVNYSEIKPTVIQADIIPRLIDEIPVIALLATQADGITTIKDAQDLRNKESDRISTIAKELGKLGAKIKQTPDGLIIHGKTKLTGGTELECYHDHRIAMSLYVAGLICEKPVKINDFQWVNTSFPEFENLIHSLL